MRAADLTRRYLRDIWSIRDPRMDDLPLLSSPLPTIAICASYALFVKVIGPALMRDRKPFKLTWVMAGYNAFQVAFSAIIFYAAMSAGWWRDYSYACQPVDYSQRPKALLMSRVCYWFYLGRFIEFFDTVFFVLRKKPEQITFLHVFHHTIMPVFLWPSVRFKPGGHGTFAGLLNSAVHTFMYMYYLLAGIGVLQPRMKATRLCKQAVTSMQLVQFALAAVHSSQLLFRDDCGFPVEYAYFSVGLMSIFIVLFLDFYVKRYLNGGEATMSQQQLLARKKKLK